MRLNIYLCFINSSNARLNTYLILPPGILSFYVKTKLIIIYKVYARRYLLLRTHLMTDQNCIFNVIASRLYASYS